jgi:hypothetical protein
LKRKTLYLDKSTKATRTGKTSESEKANKTTGKQKKIS